LLLEVLNPSEVAHLNDPMRLVASVIWAFRLQLFCRALLQNGN
jgi:hypothetical protein